MDNIHDERRELVCADTTEKGLIKVSIYNPLDIKNIVRSAYHEVMLINPTPLDQLQQFDGSGVYLLYYVGTHPLYAPMAQINNSENCTVPIYVGKSSSENDDGQTTTQKLFDRLVRHKSIISEVTFYDTPSQKINPADFKCRYLPLASLLIGGVEDSFIRHLKPLWNTKLKGIGGNVPGAGRNRQKESRWDQVHPGRRRAPNPTLNLATTVQDVASHQTVSIAARDSLK